MTLEIHPIYKAYFSQSSNPSWAEFRSKPEAVNATPPAKPDFAINKLAPLSWKDIAKKILLFVLKLVFSLDQYEFLKTLSRKIVGYVLYPAQLNSKSKLNDQRMAFFESIKRTSTLAREVLLEKNGVRYSGLIIGDQSTIKNGNWAMYAPGNLVGIEDCLFDAYGIRPLLDSSYNVLMVNGPSVGNSQGAVSPETLGDAQEIGISFLETALKAQKIVLVGQSLGAASIGEAICQHQFKPEVKYLAIRFVAFDCLTNIAAKVVGSIGRHVINWIGFEMDNMKASKKLQDLNIHEVVIQSEKDVIMNGADLAQALQKAGLTRNKTFHLIRGAYHNHNPISEIKAALKAFDATQHTA